MQLSLRSDMPQKLLVGATWLSALALTAWIVASWYWHFNGTPAQSAQPSPVSDPQAAAQDIASRQLFGAASSAATVSTAPAANFVVTGVSTRWGKLPGFAIIASGSAPAKAFVEGEEIAPGIKLVHVLASAVEIDRNGVLEQVRLNVAPRTSAETVPNVVSQPMQLNQPFGGSAPVVNN
jgi:hypothetical protein